MILRDVHYVVDFHFIMTDDATPGDNPGKFTDILRRRLAKGQCYSQPYLGTREFAAKVCPYVGEGDPQGFYSNSGTRDLGLMLFDLDFDDSANITPLYFRATMTDGVIKVAESEVYR